MHPVSHHAMRCLKLPDYDVTGAARLMFTAGQPRRKNTMPQQFNTIYQWRYEVSSPDECQVTDSAGRLILTAWPGTPEQFVADGRPVTLSSDSATLLPANGGSGPVDAGSGGAALSATGEPVVALSKSELTMKHATWFDNADWNIIAVRPGAWKNEVMTCYLKSAVPVELSGVTWIYGKPTMAEGYTFVMALQQIDATAVLANLAYVLPQ